MVIKPPALPACQSPPRPGEAQHILLCQLPEASGFPNGLLAIFHTICGMWAMFCCRRNGCTRHLRGAPSSYISVSGHTLFLSGKPNLLKPTLLQMADDLERLEHLNATVEAGMQAFYDETDAVDGVAFAQPEAGVNAIRASAEAAEAAQVGPCTHETDLCKTACLQTWTPVSALLCWQPSLLLLSCRDGMHHRLWQLCCGDMSVQL